MDRLTDRPRYAIQTGEGMGDEGMRKMRIPAFALSISLTQK